MTTSQQVEGEHGREDIEKAQRVRKVVWGLFLQKTLSEMGNLLVKTLSSPTT